MYGLDDLLKISILEMEDESRITMWPSNYSCAIIRTQETNKHQGTNHVGKFSGKNNTSYIFIPLFKQKEYCNTKSAICILVCTDFVKKPQ